MKCVYCLAYRLWILPFNSHRLLFREGGVYSLNLSDLNFDILVILVLSSRYNNTHSMFWNKLINALYWDHGDCKMKRMTLLFQVFSKHSTYWKLTCICSSELLTRALQAPVIYCMSVCLSDHILTYPEPSGQFQLNLEQNFLG